MSVKPILFNTAMVKAILDGRKTVTRRLGSWKIESYQEYTGDIEAKTVREVKQSRTTSHFYGCRRDFLEMHSQYQPGDILYVRETWHRYTKRIGKGEDCHLTEFYGYKASVKNSEDSNTPWKPSIHMPKEAARIWLKVTNVQVERLQDMPHDAAGKEGIHYCECPDGFTWNPDTDMNCCYTTPSGAFRALWDSTVKKEDINRYGWEANPWVFVIEFERCEKPQEDKK